MGEPLLKPWDQLWDRIHAEGFDSLEEFERDWIDIRFLIDLVNNGGLVSYLYNSVADRLEHSLTALHILRAADVRRNLLAACNCFPGGVNPTIEGRNQQIDGWDEYTERDFDAIEMEFKRLVPELESLLEAYLVRRYSPISND